MGPLGFPIRCRHPWWQGGLRGLLGTLLFLSFTWEAGDLTGKLPAHAVAEPCRTCDIVIAQKNVRKFGI